jgi:hypothetical protein
MNKATLPKVLTHHFIDMVVCCMEEEGDFALMINEMLDLIGDVPLEEKLLEILLVKNEARNG